jgi:hypothetical protein
MWANLGTGVRIFRYFEWQVPTNSIEKLCSTAHSKFHQKNRLSRIVQERRWLMRQGVDDARFKLKTSAQEFFNRIDPKQTFEIKYIDSL